jgi:hypothetical protein
MANRMAWMDKNGMPWKKYYNINMAADYQKTVMRKVFLTPRNGHQNHLV